jgi:hypothetical protein
MPTEEEEIDYWPCPMCGEPAEIKSTRKIPPKPYVTHQCCGIQTFWRGQVGIELLRVKLERKR